MEKEILTSELLNNNGYPTEKWLNFLEKYDPQTSNIKLKEFITDYLPKGWFYGGCVLTKKKKKWKLELHTYGWSGNEEIIDVILRNRILALYIGYYKWKAGGHYYFKIPIKFIKDIDSTIGA